MQHSRKTQGRRGPDPVATHVHFLLSRAEVDALYGISKRFLEIAACKGDGPAFVKVGRLTRYRVQDIEDWICRNRYSNTAQVLGAKDGEP